MKPKDAIGNELEKGMWVGVKVGTEFLVGKIITLDEGGTPVIDPRVKPGQLSPGLIVMGIEYRVMFQPGTFLGNLYRVVDPLSTATVEKALDAKPEDLPTIKQEEKLPKDKSSPFIKRAEDLKN